ncbi:esterase-like activity of phytase family protein [Pelagibacterium sediminicola]|uniref:esterase-like activity of phytase family protein n=1 Tax=Pelagibacterium sediminicola TaxID=2248761 RepID=UPI000E30C5D8|nr:esterase-like activity of phytase family protein [Pelagibacterium sediminicola]
MRGARYIGLLIGLLWGASTLAAEPVSITSTPIATFKGAAIGQPVDGLVFRGGFVMTGDRPEFGGLSSLAFLDAARFVMVTDEGRFVSGELTPAGLENVEIDVIRNSAGNPLPSKFSSDSEAIEVVFRDGAPATVRVGFEHLARLADFELANGRPHGAARPVAIPDWMTALRDNGSIESVCIAPPASPIAGSTLIIAEGHSRAPGTWAATLLGVHDKGDLHLVQSPGLNPTDCAFLPDGDLLVLERGLSFLTFSMQIRRIPAQTVRPGATLDGEIILVASGAQIDNMEGLGVRTLPDGEVRIAIVSDDNFNRFQRNILLDFALP